jgi:hypothetical protein
LEDRFFSRVLSSFSAVYFLYGCRFSYNFILKGLEVRNSLPSLPRFVFGKPHSAPSGTGKILFSIVGNDYFVQDATGCVLEILVDDLSN